MQRIDVRRNPPPRRQAFRLVPSSAAEARSIDAAAADYLRHANFEITGAAGGMPVEARIAHHRQTSMAVVSAPEMTIRWNRHAHPSPRALLLFARAGALAVSGRGVLLREGGTAALIPPGDTPVAISTTEIRNEFVYISVGAEAIPPALQIRGESAQAPMLSWRSYAPLYAFIQAACMTQPANPGEPDVLAACIDVILASAVNVLLSDLAEPPGRLAQVRAFIAEHHTDPQVTPFTIATDFALPPRSLQALFAEDDSTVRDELRTARARTATRLRESQPLLSQAQRAQLSGFASLSAMYRALQAVENGSGLSDIHEPSALRA